LRDKHHEFLFKQELAEQFGMAHDIGAIFIKASVRGDDPALIFADICEHAGVEPQKDEDDFSTYDFIAAFFTGIDKLTNTARRIFEASSTIPNLRSVSYVCDARIVLENDFDLFKDDLESFSPKKMGFEPVGVISLKTNEDKVLHFQVGLDGLDILISALSSMKKVMKLVEETIPSSEKEGE